jgi:hypothetical protein
MWTLNIVIILIFYAIVLINPTFHFIFIHSNMLSEIIIPPTEKKKKNGDENLLQKVCSIGASIMAPLDSPYA